MVLPMSIFAIKAAVLVQGTVFVVNSLRAEATLRARQFTDSTLGRPELLLGYRVLMFAWALFIGLRQLADKGPVVFGYFTVWNWWLLMLYFGLASAASLRAQRRAARGYKGARRGSADWLERSLHAALHVAAPAALVVDFLTWSLLVPALLRNPNEQARAFWRRVMFSFESYNQHGFNVAMVAGELALSTAPFDVYTSGWLAIWNVAYGVWSTIYFVRNGRFIYPFLDAHRPHAWVGYVAMFVLHCTAVAIFAVATWARDMLVARIQRRRRVAAAAAAKSQ